MSGNVTTGSQTTGLNNKDLNATISKIAKGISAEYTPGKSLFVGPGATTTQGWQNSLLQAGNQDYASGINGAIGDFGQIAAGNRFGQNAPGFATLRQNLSNDVLKQANASFNNSGLFGSDSNQRAVGEGLGNALAGLDYSKYQNDISRQERAAAMLPQLFQAGQLPSSIMQSVGASQDAAAQGAANGPTDYLSKITDIAARAGGAAGTTTSNQVPWWAALLGGASTIAGAVT